MVLLLLLHIFDSLCFLNVWSLYIHDFKLSVFFISTNCKLQKKKLNLLSETVYSSKTYYVL